MKYRKEVYLDCGFFGTDMETTMVSEEEKIVKVKREHSCTGGFGHNCQKIIPKGEYALRNTALFSDVGYKSCYVCLPCIEEWLEESGQVTEKDLIK